MHRSDQLLKQIESWEFLHSPSVGPGLCPSAHRHEETKPLLGSYGSSSDECVSWKTHFLWLCLHSLYFTLPAMWYYTLDMKSKQDPGENRAVLNLGVWPGYKMQRQTQNGGQLLHPPHRISAWKAQTPPLFWYGLFFPQALSEIRDLH